MERFIARHHSLVTGVLSGFDRLVFRGHLLPLMPVHGLHYFLAAAGIPLLGFGDFARATTERVKTASLAKAHELGRPIRYLKSPKIDKEAFARKLLVEHPVKKGLVCVLQAVEPCRTFEYHLSKNPAERGFQLQNGKCLHFYKYAIHPRFGFMSARIQTWFPFTIQICMNGREWPAHQLEREGRADFTRADNCFTRLGNPALAQRRMNRQLETDWPRELLPIARSLNPLHGEIFARSPMDYYWSAYQTEWATDVMFKDPRALANLYPQFVRLAMHHFKSPDVMRFLAKKSHGNFTGEIVSGFKDRPEGVRVKHSVRGNSVKMYDKAASVLRVETTISKTGDFKVLRPPHDEPEGKLDWRPLRKGVADLHRRAEVSQRSNEAYLDALAAVEDTTPCGRLFDTVSRPVVDRGRRVRAMRLGDPADIALLEAVARGEYATAGFRNRDLRLLLYPSTANAPKAVVRRHAAKIGRHLRLLRAHGIIRKIQKTHRYRLATRGELLTTALFATRSASIKQLLPMAA